MGVLKLVEFSAHTHSRSLFLDDFFAYLQCSAPSTWSKKSLEKKLTDIRENLADLEVGWDLFTATQNTDTARKSAQNESEIKDPNSLNKSTNRHLRLLLGRWHSPQVAPAAQKIFLKNKNNQYLSSQFAQCTNQFAKKKLFPGLLISDHKFKLAFTRMLSRRIFPGI